MSDIPTITIDMGKKCAECGKGGAANSGLCMGCTARAVRGLRMRSARGRYVQKHIKKIVTEAKRK